MLRSDQDTSSSPSTKSKHPGVPPPPYREFATEPGPSSPAPALNVTTHFMQPPQIPSQIPTGVPMAMPPHLPTGYGPTPLATNQPLLPYAYYESRGSADARARLRFIHALVWAIALWLMFGFMIGVEVWSTESWDLKSWLGLERRVFD
ncbi:hypothetical protein AGABI1DRAFT_113185 [Agaricus bisporus var. burnettii JB137-S8]|uniref:Uncharacterized protein n=1 Tax=Agaricus bisporus var. burnettii (strain JB137-S8 / ATCC MYA-4627 / FGSC 10392) TaxID=597362 RepID=K5WWS0_AGABU|nr:uncharacterized protein AGABI1DRAFT_113185 [Agaricus bisporus var. burnettii JB137-S8]EKM79941.1 hypothetical protein AGABI1DRAFT_113185 [Agaricus bisporus var. burnettii JB137-S8]